MRMIVANNAVERLAQLGQGERICSGPIENEMGLAIRFENVPGQFSDATGPFVVTVGNGSAEICLFQLGQDFGADPRGVVARELVMLTTSLHVDLATRLPVAQQTNNPLEREKLPDGPEPQGLQGPPDKSL